MFFLLLRAHKLRRYYCIHLKFIFFIVHILKALFNSVRVANNSQTFFNKEDNISSQITDVSIKDVYREQRRYESFWEGVNRGIYLDSINPKLIDGNKNKRALTMKKVNQYILDEDLIWQSFTCDHIY